jgi:hypothetical protein
MELTLQIFEHADWTTDWTTRTLEFDFQQRQIFLQSVYNDKIRMDDRGVRILAGARDVFFCTAFREAVGPTRLPLQWVLGLFPLQ